MNKFPKKKWAEKAAPAWRSPRPVAPPPPSSPPSGAAGPRARRRSRAVPPAEELVLFQIKDCERPPLTVTFTKVHGTMEALNFGPNFKIVFSDPKFSKSSLPTLYWLDHFFVRIRRGIFIAT